MLVVQVGQGPGYAAQDLGLLQRRQAVTDGLAKILGLR